MTLLNLFFLHVPLFKGSKSLKYSLYLIRLILDVFLIYARTSSTFSGANALCPVPLLGTSLISAMYEKSYGRVSFKKSKYRTYFPS